MTIQHTNRQGKDYYLFQGITKTGKPKYYFSTKNEGCDLNIIPEGYEIYENPNGQVFLRKKQLQLITDIEKKMVSSKLSRNKDIQFYIIDIKKKVLTIYTAEIGESIIPDGLLPFNKLDIMKQFLNYSPEMRFTLTTSKNDRNFYAERFCYRGSIDDWITIGGTGKLKELVDKFIPCLGNDSFYELGRVF